MKEQDKVAHKVQNERMQVRARVCKYVCRAHFSQVPSILFPRAEKMPTRSGVVYGCVKQNSSTIDPFFTSFSFTVGEK